MSKSRRAYAGKMDTSFDASSRTLADLKNHAHIIFEQRELPNRVMYVCEQPILFSVLQRSTLAIDLFIFQFFHFSIVSYGLHVGKFAVLRTRRARSPRKRFGTLVAVAFIAGSYI